MTLILIFLFVYFGMFLGEIPGLALDRTGVALIGAIAVLVTGRLQPEEAWQAVDFATLGLLFGLMIVSAQFRLGGFYVRVTRHIADVDTSPKRLLLLLILTAGILSSLLANDIVCLAMTPILLEACSHRRLNPMPFLLGLACASNVGSAATLIGNPQNMLIGQVLKLSFSGYLLDAAVPALLGLFLTWWVICWRTGNHWNLSFLVREVDAPEFNRWQTSKGIVILLILVAGFLFSPWPREVLALLAAGLILSSRRMATRNMLSLVDWHLLVLFMSLFVVNHAMKSSGQLAIFLSGIENTGIRLQEPAWLFGSTVVLSNLVSNVPAVMLLLPIATHPLAGPILALSSTLAGNLIIVGSIANIIVVEKAKEMDYNLSWRDHAAIGIPVTGLTLVVTAAWLYLRWQWPV